MLQDRLRRKPILEEFLQHFIHFSEPHEVLKVLACKHDVFPDYLTEDPLIKAAFSQSKACHLLSSKICPRSITLEIYKALILSVNRYNLLQQCNLDLNYSIHRAKAL
ncbi:hypothetical protein Nepgr_012097 [Nepenthes gracilis]|uniref:Uncharacterized protein n=1 Tax=Nepenthes gracilis TaxID=150966 RepID=A0AAD3SGW8_NEPGR|nr:hypothetical protein Nepgr_012097 [Nepenthes gracilis]